MKKIKNYYELCLKTHKSGYRAVNWSSKSSQELRFQKICEVGDLKGRSIHDVGCGLGHLNKYLKKNKMGCSYIGTDISSKMIYVAKKNDPSDKKKFYCLNVLDLKKESKKFKADFVVNSGIFTVKASYNQEIWWNFVTKMIKVMYKLSNKGIAFNMMTNNVDYKEKHLFYVSPLKVINFLEKSESKKIVFKQNYKLWENTYYVYK